MGRYTNGRLASTIGWSTGGIMAAAGAISIYTALTGIGG
jgi:hypothetical protein